MLNSKILISVLFTSLTIVLGDVLDLQQFSGSWLSPPIPQAMAQGNDEATAQRLLNEGRQQLLSDDPDVALQSLQAALKIYRSRQNKLGQQETLDALGSAHLFLEDLTQASNYLQQAIKVSQQNSDPVSKSLAANSHDMLGQIYLQQSTPQKALAAFDYRLQMAKSSPGGDWEASAFHNFGITYLAMKDYNKALQSFQKSMELKGAAGDHQSDPEENARTLSLLGYTYLQMNNRQQAEATLLQALNQGEQSGSELLPSIITQVEQQIEALKATYGNNPQLLKAIEALKTKQLSTNKLRQNIKSGNLDQIDLLRAQRSEDSNAAICSLLQKIYADQDKEIAALEMSERCRARALVRRLFEKLDGDTVTDKIAPPVLQQIRQIAKTQKATLVQYSILAKDAHAPNTKNTVESDLLIWVIPPSGEVTFRRIDLQASWLKDGQSLNDLVNQSRQAMGVRGRAAITVKPKVDNNAPADQDALKQLHALLIAPIADALPTAPDSHVIFIPQGVLFSVPFPALTDGSGQYLVDRHTILTAPSIQTLELTRRRHSQVRESGNQQVLVVGNPTMPQYPQRGGQVLPTLPGAEAEANQIASLYKTQALTGSQASETAVTAKLQQARIAHFATHGLLDSRPKMPLGLQLLNFGSVGKVGGLSTPGAIALAPGDNQDGLLTSDEITKLTLNTELVVLSACDTGQGTILSDGVVGLSRSLLTAGAPSVLVSLWKVPDEATADLMVDFYRQLQSSPNKAQALRQAMLKVRQKYPNPVDWAAFTLVGEAG
jgi:CHAT domain-containing protein